MRRLIALIGAGVLAVILTVQTAEFYSELLWFESIGFGDSFWTMYLSEYGFGAAYFLAFWVIVGINLLIVSRVPIVQVSQQGAVFQQAMAWVSKPAKAIFYVVLVFLAYVMAATPASRWMRVMQYWHSENFGTTDAVFGNDIGFYINELPFIQSTINWLFMVTIVSVLAVLVAYFMKRGVTLTPQGVTLHPTARRHVFMLGGLLFALYAVDYYYTVFDVLFNDHGVVFGAGYTDIYARVTGYRMLIVTSALGMAGCVVAAFRNSWKWVGWSVGVHVAVAVVMLIAYPAIMQKFIVGPNELEKEKPYIVESIRQTRLAYELDRIEERNFNFELSLTGQDIRDNHLTIKNVTLWDYRPLGDSYAQLQGIRPYYVFADIDIDRYVINGEYRQVMLSGRELKADLLGSGSNWINNTFVYTHGHGVVMSPVNVVTQEGQPEFILKNIPTESVADIALERPEIYFGEIQSPHDYIIVKTSKEEFDYPLGESNKQATYLEESGVGIGTFWSKMMFAIRFQKLNILLNDYIQPQSRIIYYRNIRQRVEKIAPFIRYDRDPFMVVENGRLYWILDGYTASDQYPYARMSYERPASPFEAGRSFNYLRNSVKVVIDAYNGTTTFYSFRPENDPLIRIYSRIFPKVFRPLNEMPDGLRKHLRYPQDLFDIQAKLFAVYHMEDPNVFFNREDVWSISEEKYGDTVQQMESYYVIMKLPNEAREEFLLMVPFNPNNKSNMIAWFCARSDGDHYGKLLVYKFPKSELVYGPMQVESRIDQTPEISEKLSLWNQQGSRVTRGNLLVIPIRNSVLYVEPLYLQSEQSRMPELKKVIVAYGNSIFMEDNLEIGLEKIFGLGVAGRQTLASVAVDLKALEKTALTTGRVPLAIRDLSRSAMNSYNAAQDAIRKGDWKKYGEELEKLRKDLEKLVDQTQDVQ